MKTTLEMLTLATLFVAASFMIGNGETLDNKEETTVAASQPDRFVFFDRSSCKTSSADKEDSGKRLYKTTCTKFNDETVTVDGTSMEYVVFPPAQCDSSIPGRISCSKRGLSLAIPYFMQETNI